MPDIKDLVARLRRLQKEWPDLLICLEAVDAIEQLQAEQVKDLADVERFRGMARAYMDERDALRARVAELEAELESVCRHENCEMVSGRKQDYLYCRDCRTNLSSTGE